MTTTTAPAPSVDIPPDDDLPLSAHLTEPARAGAEPFASPETPAQSAARRLGGKGGRSWRPDSGGRSLILKIVSGLLVCLLLGTVISLWLTVRQQQIQLTTLDMAFRSGQLQTLPDRMLDTENRLKQFTQRYQADTDKLQQLGGEFSGLQTQYSRLAADVKTTQSAVAQMATGKDETDTKLVAFQKTLDAQALRLGALESWKAEWSQRSAAPATRSALPAGEKKAAVKKPSKPRILKSPFTLVSIERRGGQAYAVILPQGEGSWAQLRMLSPGEGHSGWTLVSISGNQAQFNVNGQVQRLTL